MYYRFKEEVCYIPEQICTIEIIKTNSLKAMFFDEGSIVRINDQGFMEHYNGVFNIEPFKKYLEFSK